MRVNRLGLQRRGPQDIARVEAMNVPYTAAMGSIRFSLGRFNTEDEVDKTVVALVPIIEDLKRMGGF